MGCRRVFGGKTAKNSRPSPVHNAAEAEESRPAVRFPFNSGLGQNEANSGGKRFAGFQKSVVQGVASSGKTDTIAAMSPTDTILKFGLRIGRISGAPVRVSFLFVVVAAALIWRLNDVALGTIISLVLLGSVLTHEIAHLVVARSTAGDLDELDLWPLGGLSEPFGRGYWRDHVQTMMAGPFFSRALATTQTVP